METTQEIKRDAAAEMKYLQDTLYVINGKWKIPIINSLCNGNRRYREIQRSIPGITSRMLSKELKELEMNKIIRRVVKDEPGILVEYETTPYCKTFSEIILAMIDWGKQHYEVLKKEAVHS
ncbi:winged helix-turn-helix transcriptional regulator [Flavobacterium hauense]